ncbi:MAG: DUF4124 domain-containing protein [Proteobacteria bacterium]|nr:DUF4124 domain-containing protein [Pseudomonadota bacterium]
MNRILVLLALSGFMLGAYATDQQVYKWTDAAGVVHFSDAPPPKDAKDVQLMRVSGSDRPRSVDAQPNGEPGSSQEGGNNGAASAAPVDPKDANAKACATARNNLDLLQSKMPISVTGADGKPIPLDDKAREAQVAAANANIALYCK